MLGVQGIFDYYLKLNWIPFGEYVVGERSASSARSFTANERGARSKQTSARNGVAKNLTLTWPKYDNRKRQDECDAR